MPWQRTSILAALATAGCATYGPTVDHDTATTPVTPWGPLNGNIDGAGYPPRLGPSTAPWADVDARPLPAVEQIVGDPLLLGGAPSVVANGLAVMQAGSLRAVDLETNTDAWTSTLPFEPGSVASDGERLCGILASDPTELACLGLDDGVERWRATLGARFDWGRVLIGFDPGRVRVVGALDSPGTLASFDADSGAPVFTVQDVYGTPRSVLAAGDDLLVVAWAGAGAAVFALDPTTGAERARLDLPDLLQPSGTTVRSLGATPVWIDGDEVTYQAAVQQNAFMPAWTVSGWVWTGSAFVDAPVETAALLTALVADVSSVQGGPGLYALSSVGTDRSALVLNGQTLCVVDPDAATVRWCAPGVAVTTAFQVAGAIGTNRGIYDLADGHGITTGGFVFAYEQWAFENGNYGSIR